MLTYFNQVFPKEYISMLLILFSIFTYNNIMSLNAQEIAEFSKNSGLFTMDVFKTLEDEKPNQNIVFSPFSIQTCVAMARMGAEGKTAAEIDRGLRLVSSNTTAIADSFSTALANYVNSDVLKIANKMYFMKGYTVQKEFNEILTKKFFSTADVINFAQSEEAAKTINGWVESKTNNLIKGLITPDMLDGNTRLVLLNAIHFKGTWKYQFPKNQTRDEDFYLNESDTVKVPMMNMKGGGFPFATLKDLDATALEMPYKDSDLSMLVILPNSRTGLKNLEAKLITHPLSDITSKLDPTDVNIKLPKFKAEFEMNLNEALQKLGINRVFTSAAELGKTLEGSTPIQVSAVVHKAFIDVNEEGTEAAAATAMVGTAFSALPSLTEFIANKPFVYFIKTKTNNILFGGKVMKLP